MQLAAQPFDDRYSQLLADLGGMLESARRTSARAVNAVMTATYWEFGQRIVEFELHGEKRAGYGEELMRRLARDLTARLGRGFSLTNLQNFRTFYLDWPIHQTVSGESTPPVAVGRFRLPWSHYVRLMAVRDREARGFYESEALRGGWSVRQLDRQIGTAFYERTARSQSVKSNEPRKDEVLSAADELKDPLLLEFLDLKDEYSESELEEALLRHLETFLLELGRDFTFVGRQRRLRVGDTWYRIDLLFFHRRLRCLVVIDLKIGRLSHADAGQMHLYLNYAARHWTNPGENPPVGLILCSESNDALAEYALDGLPNKVLAREYKLALPAPKLLAGEIGKIRERLEARSK